MNLRLWTQFEFPVLTEIFELGTRKPHTDTRLHWGHVPVSKRAISRQFWCAPYRPVARPPILLPGPGSAIQNQGSQCSRVALFRADCLVSLFGPPRPAPLAPVPHVFAPSGLACLRLCRAPPAPASGRPPPHAPPRAASVERRSCPSAAARR